MPNLEDRYSLSGPLLVIETFGAKGLRYRDQRNIPGQNSEWQHLPALPVEVVRDAGGSGDWCTAGFIHRLGQTGLEGFRTASADDLQEALRFGQALAAWGCAFEGAPRSDVSRQPGWVCPGRAPGAGGGEAFPAGRRGLVRSGRRVSARAARGRRRTDRRLNPPVSRGTRRAASPARAG